MATDTTDKAAEKAAKAKLEALNGALGQIDKQFGKGSIMRMGDEDAVIYRRFYHTFGCDVMSAQGLGRNDAELLAARIELQNTLDGTVSSL